MRLRHAPDLRPVRTGTRAACKRGGACRAVGIDLRTGSSRSMMQGLPDLKEQMI
jgi:hypothetical protein